MKNRSWANKKSWANTISELNKKIKAMSKDNIELKDVIHLYLGCEVILIGKKPGIKHYNLVGITIDGGCLFRTIPEGFSIDLGNDWKPILRKLDSMTEEEQIWLYLCEFPNYKSGELVKNNSDNDFFIVRNENGMRCHVNLHHFSAETTRKLLKAGFDLFQLIEKGLAIDKNSKQ